MGLLLAAFVLAGCGASGSTEERSAMQDPDTPKIVVDVRESAEWLADAMQSSGYRADFSPESAWEIDRFFAEQLRKPGKPKRRGLLDESHRSRLFAIGAYVGEVVRRNTEGWEWSPPEDDPDVEVSLSLIRGDEIIWPIQRVMKRFSEGEENAIAAYVMAVADLDVGPRPQSRP